MDKKICKILIAFVFSLAFISIAPRSAYAVNLHFSPSSGEYTVGKTLSISVYVESANQAINAASGAVSFPKDKLEVTSVSKSGSIISLWIQEPSFSNVSGTVNFEGIVLNPGFTGAKGKIVTINFKAKAAGLATVSFSAGSVLANDGAGTNILTNLENAEFNLGGILIEPVPAILLGAPLKPEIFSSTHPNSNKWYTLKDAQFSWATPSDITAIRFLANKIPDSFLSAAYPASINEREIKDLADGIWYFHLQFKNAIGWGEISHFRFQIDTEAPEPFIIKFADSEETSSLNPKVVFKTADATSGISHYRIKLNEDKFFPVIPETDPFILSLQNPGKQSILVQAFDNAGNYSAAFSEFNVVPLQTPVFTEYPKELKTGQTLIVKGETIYMDSQIMIFMEKEKEGPENFTVRTKQDGKFTFTNNEKLEDGVYRLSAEVIDNNTGAKSLKSEEITVLVTKPLIFRIGNSIISFLGVIIPLAILIIALLFVLWYGGHRFLLWRKKLQNEVRKTESNLYRDFELLKENMKGQVKMLEEAKTKRSLTEEEEKITEQLKKDLDNTERFVRKEIEDLERNISN